MENDDERVARLAEKLAELINSVDGEADPYVFNQEEVRALKRVIRLLEWLDQMAATGGALWLVAKFIGAAVALVLLLMANWERLLEWLRG